MSFTETINLYFEVIIMTEVKHLNELAAEEEVKRKAGRPKADNTKALEVLHADEQKRKEFRSALAFAVDSKRKVATETAIHRSNVKSLSETFGLTKAFVNAAVEAKVQENADKKIKENSNMAELLSFIDAEYADEMDNY